VNIDEFAKKSPLMEKILPQIEKFSKYDSSVLLRENRELEKEIIARIIHQLSHRSDKEFIYVKCDNLTGLF